MKGTRALYSSSFFGIHVAVWDAKNKKVIHIAGKGGDSMTLKQFLNGAKGPRYDALAVNRLGDPQEAKRLAEGCRAFAANIKRYPTSLELYSSAKKIYARQKAIASGKPDPGLPGVASNQKHCVCVEMVTEVAKREKIKGLEGALTVPEIADKTTMELAMNLAA